jgi:hypothetical protein
MPQQLDAGNRLPEGDFSTTLREKINAYLHRRWKDALIFLFFFFLAGAFWYLQSLQQDYETYISIPIRYRNMPDNISFTDTVPDKITVHVRDKGSHLLNYTVGASFPVLDINLKELSGQGVFNLTPKEMQGALSQTLFSTTAILDFAPSQLQLKYNRRKEKRLPVVFNGKVNLAPGFRLVGDIIITPSAVKAYGTSATLDTLHSLQTVFTDIKQLNASGTFTLPLQKRQGASFQTTEVTVTFPVEEFTEKDFDIPVVLTGIPNGYTVRLFPPTIKVVCHIPLSRFKELTPEDFALQLPFAELRRNYSGQAPIRLTRHPEWVQTINLVPDKVEFLLEKQTGK